MRIRVTGDTESARVIRAYLTKAGIAVSERLPKFALHCTIHLSEHSGSSSIIVDSVDSLLELHILRHITENITSDVILRRRTGIVSSENEIHLSIPVGDADAAHAVEVGVLRGVQRAHFHRPWWKRLLPLAALALVPTAHAAPPRYSIFVTTETAAIRISMPPGGLFPQFQTGGGTSPCSGVTAPAHSFCGNNTGSVAAPAYVSLTAADLPGLITSNTSGNAATTTAFDHNPGDCTAGQAATGIDSTGLATGCFTPGGLANPMTTLGDIIYGAASGTPTRLPIGASTTLLHGGSIPTYSAVVQGDVTNGYDDLSSAQNVGGAKTLTGEASAGNIALKNKTLDYIQYVTPNGNDSNDGLSWGTAKLTPQAAINVFPGGLTGGGTVHVACGTYVGPTTIQNGIVIIGECGQASIAMVSAHIVFTYTTSLTLNATLNVQMVNITLDFFNCAAVGCGLVLSGGAQDNSFVHLSLNQCGSTTVACISFTNTVALAVAFNTFDHTVVYGNTATTGVAGPAKACIFVNGQGTPNAGPTITQNTFEDLFCRGALTGGIDSELNSDSNYYLNVKFLQEAPGTPANSYVLGFNLLTPATDQDADTSYFYGINFGGNFTTSIRAGQTAGNYIQFENGGGPPSLTTVGGAPSFIMQVVSLNGGISDTVLGNGRLTVTATTPTFATGMQSGDIGAVRTSTFGALFLGSDGANIFRSAGELVGVCTSGTGGCDWRTPEIAAPTGVASQGIIWPDSTAHKWKANNNNGGAVTFGYIDLAQTWTANQSFNSGTLLPSAAGGTDLGSAALPFGNLWLGTAATNNFKFQPATTSGARIITIADPLSPTTVALPLTIASGTSAMTTAGVTTGACGTTVTTAGTGILTTDSIEFTRNAAPTNANGGNLILNSWVTAGNVNFNYCNPGAATVTPTAMTLNWRVIR